MTILLTLFTKVYSKGQRKQLETSLQTIFEDIDAQMQILNTPNNQWIQIEITGEDENVAKNYITKQIGTCPNSIDEITTGTELKGYIKKSDNTEKLNIDIGILEPKVIRTYIPLTTLQTQLLNGKEVSLKKIAELFTLNTNLPISIKINTMHITENTIEAELSTTQIKTLKEWRESLLDRLIIIGATTDEITEILERTRLNRDIINIEELGLYEQVLTCKLGTDATGLIPIIGRYMRNTKITVFNPKKIAL